MFWGIKACEIYRQRVLLRTDGVGQRSICSVGATRFSNTTTFFAYFFIYIKSVNSANNIITFLIRQVQKYQMFSVISRYNVSYFIGLQKNVQNVHDKTRYSSGPGRHMSTGDLWPSRSKLECIRLCIVSILLISEAAAEFYDQYHRLSGCGPLGRVR